ncbi:uncharacterized protein LOC113775745 isoform X1 [Coffea eugenioides]|uniref:uncharacterized protein LOC113775745 isoform X1 n=1 Tax=Coffea eugenioides TaxID=49369 RepID=UPI000F6150C3|nr:uncharacterized protein LOC113775745 isoform X1 [Coffea eugenioides]
MLQRQDSLLSSSHRQTPPPENRHAKQIGCMAGFFKLLSRYQNRNKRLTSGRKHVKSTSKEAKAMVEQEMKQQQQDSSSALKEDNKNISNTNGQNLENKRLSSSCDITPRSPMLPPEIRQSNALTTSEKSTTAKSLLVARLMGLEEPSEVNRNVKVEQEKSSSSTTEEKRRKLLRALEKCNEDLESLKKIIVAVQSDQKKRLKPPPPVMKEDHNLAKTCLKRNAEQLMMRPVAALEEMSRYYHTTKANSNGIIAHQSKRISVKKPREEDNICYFTKVNTATVKEKHRITTPRFWSSKAMIQSVDEVCNHISWGEKRELGNIGMVLQNYICKDLIEEVLYDLGFCKMHELPLEACKRRLSF